MKQQCVSSSKPRKMANLTYSILLVCVLVSDDLHIVAGTSAQHESNGQDNLRVYMEKTREELAEHNVSKVDWWI